MSFVNVTSGVAVAGTAWAASDAGVTKSAARTQAGRANQPIE